MYLSGYPSWRLRSRASCLPVMRRGGSISARRGRRPTIVMAVSGTVVAGFTVCFLPRCLFVAAITQPLRRAACRPGHRGRTSARWSSRTPFRLSDRRSKRRPAAAGRPCGITERVPDLLSRFVDPLLARPDGDVALVGAEISELAIHELAE